VTSEPRCAAPSDDKVTLAAVVTPYHTERFRVAGLVREVAAVVGGKGGGRPDFAQAGGRDPGKVDEALERFRALVREKAGA